jgi:hypothetical protein
MPPPLLTAEYSGRLMSGWRRSALKIIVGRASVIF